MGRKIIDYIFVAFCGSAAVFVKANWYKSGWESWIMPALSAGILYVAFQLVFSFPFFFLFFRKFWIPMAAAEGDWIEQVIKEDVKYYSLFSLKYEWKSNSYGITGIALTDEGEIHATWTSSEIDFDAKQLQLRYHQMALRTGRNEIPGITRLFFYGSSGRSFEEGQGYFIEFDEKPIRGDFSFVRVTPDMITQLLGKKAKRLCKEDRENFVRKYHARKIKDAKL